MQKITDIHTLKSKAVNFKFWKAKKNGAVLCSSDDEKYAFSLLCEFIRDNDSYDTIILSSATNKAELAKNTCWANGFIYHRQMEAVENNTPVSTPAPQNTQKFSEIMGFVSQLNSASVSQVQSAISSTNLVNDKLTEFYKVTYEGKISDLTDERNLLREENTTLKEENQELNSNVVSTSDKIISGLKEALKSGVLGGFVPPAGGVAGIEEEDNEDLELLFELDEDFDSVLKTLVEMISKNKEMYNKMFHPQNTISNA